MAMDRPAAHQHHRYAVACVFASDESNDSADAIPAKFILIAMLEPKV